jgi:hypothetical protein
MKELASARSIAAPRSVRFNIRAAGQTVRNISGRVTIETAKAMPKNYNEMPNEILLTMAVGGDQEAREERVIREIMSVDNIEWDKAQEKLGLIKTANRRGLSLITLPYKVGVIVPVVAGLASFPMIFHLDTVLVFNEHFVTTGMTSLWVLFTVYRIAAQFDVDLFSDVPEDRDLETPLEVASWAWNWMEPPLGQYDIIPWIHIHIAQINDLSLYTVIKIRIFVPFTELSLHST